MAALGLLVGSKVLNVQVPMIFKLAIDNLNEANAVSGGAVVCVLQQLPSLHAALWRGAP